MITCPGGPRAARVSVATRGVNDDPRQRHVELGETNLIGNDIVSHFGLTY